MLQNSTFVYYQREFTLAPLLRGLSGEAARVNGGG
jgi:hypothetical protein